MRMLPSARRNPFQSPVGERLLIVFLLGGALVLTGCADDQDGSNEDDQSSEQSSQESMNADGEASRETVSGSTGGPIHVESGNTQEEQIAELSTVVAVMREHFGAEVATIDGERWTPERHDAEVAADSEGDGVYRHTLEFDIPSGDLEETYDIAATIAEELGLSENSGNSKGITEYDKTFYGAGQEEGRTFVIASTTSGDGYRASYQTRHSDDPSLEEAFERVVEENSEDRDEDDPLQVDDLEDVPGHEEDDSSG